MIVARTRSVTMKGAGTLDVRVKETELLQEARLIADQLARSLEQKELSEKDLNALAAYRRHVSELMRTGI